ncbi:hypothetical protein BLA29_007961, partial [Euroglyphus maynei]
YLRGYGCSNGWFSFECGRKCSTGQGHHIFECSCADQLFDTLVQQIGNQQHLSHSHSHSQMSNDLISMSNNGPLSLHEYQNLASFTSDLIRPGSNLDHVTSGNSQIPTTRSSSSTGVHTYLNSTVINGQMKSQPNYYSTNPMSHNSSGASSRLNGSKHSLNETGLNGHHNYLWSSSSSSGHGNHSFDSRTLPLMMRKENSSSHAYVNASEISNNNNNNNNNNDSSNNRIRRSRIKNRFSNNNS